MTMKAACDSALSLRCIMQGFVFSVNELSLLFLRCQVDYCTRISLG